MRLDNGEQAFAKRANNFGNKKEQEGKNSLMLAAHRLGELWLNRSD